MDTFTTRRAGAAGGYAHHSDRGFCTVCGTTWPCWRGLGQDAGVESIPRSGRPLAASIGGRLW